MIYQHIAASKSAFVQQLAVAYVHHGYWGTIDQDFRWHIEILPIIPGKARSYSFKEVYFNSLPPPEVAAKELREAGTTRR